MTKRPLPVFFFKKKISFVFSHQYSPACRELDYHIAATRTRPSKLICNRIISHQERYSATTMALPCQPLLIPPACCNLSISLWYRSLNPLQSARMSGYWFFSSSYACGTTRTIHALTREVRDALKQR